MYKFVYFKIEIKTKVDLYMPCEAIASVGGKIIFDWLLPIAGKMAIARDGKIRQN